MIVRSSTVRPSSVCLRPVQALVALAALALAGCATPEEPEPAAYANATTREQVLAASARQRALDTLASGATLEWRSPDGSAVGRITPTRTFRADNGAYCREFDEEVNLDGQTDRFTDLRCRTQAGRWLRPEG